MKKYDNLQRELQDVHDSHEAERQELEKKLRSSNEKITALQEEADESREELSTIERQLEHQLNELKSHCDGLRRNNEDIGVERDTKEAELQITQQKLIERESRVESLEDEILQLKAQAGESHELVVVKRELSDQIAHIKKLEATNTTQLTELKQLRDQRKAVEVVEEEKRTLEARLCIMHDLRKELGEAQLQRQILEDERRSWSAYLESMGQREEDTPFDSPEDLAKAFVKERLERLSLVDELGKYKPELSAKDEMISALENEKLELKAELQATKNKANGPDPKLRARLERQRALAVKEVEYLRAQLKMFDTETNEFQPESYDEQKAQQVKDLEDLVDQYRKEIHSLHTDLTKKETESANGSTSDQQSPVKLLKRNHTEEDDERLGTLTRKNNTLQTTLSKLTTAHAMLDKELEAHRSQLSALKSTSRTRVLELRNNPTAASEAVKLSTLKMLRAENEALLASLEAAQKEHPLAQGSSSVKLVPYAHLERLRADLATKDAELASAAKHTLRLKQIFGAKSAEFREAVASILGWRFDFMPNGRVRVTSMFHPGDPESEEGENSIVFDSDQGTMKVSGGPRSAFANEIRGLIEFWVDGRKEIPCFLAACTLEFWERTTRALNV